MGCDAQLAFGELSRGFFRGNFWGEFAQKCQRWMSGSHAGLRVSICGAVVIGPLKFTHIHRQTAFSLL